METSKDERELRWNVVADFIDKHRSSFNEFELMRIKHIFLNDSFPESYHFDVIREICDEFGLIPDDENIYLAFLRELENTFDIPNRHIIEVGGGMVPCLGRRINLLQTGGSITVYDPRLLDCYEDGDNFVLKREEFTHDSKLGNTNLLIGLMPCKGAEVLIDQAIKNEIDFMVWLCEGGPHGDYFDFYEDDEEWMSAVISTALHGIRRKNMGELKKMYIKKFSKDYPIISSKRN